MIKTRSASCEWARGQKIGQWRYNLLKMFYAQTVTNEEHRVDCQMQLCVIDIWVNGGPPRREGER